MRHVHERGLSCSEKNGVLNPRCGIVHLSSPARGSLSKGYPLDCEGILSGPCILFLDQVNAGSTWTYSHRPRVNNGSGVRNLPLLRGPLVHIFVCRAVLRRDKKSEGAPCLRLILAVEVFLFSLVFPVGCPSTLIQSEGQEEEKPEYLSLSITVHSHFFLPR